MMSPSEDARDTFDPGGALLEPLTERELEILGLLGKGATNREVAVDLALSLDTIKWYNKRLYAKLQVRNRTQAVARARELGLLGEGEPASGGRDPSAAAIPVHALPVPDTPFLGRELERAQLAELLAEGEARLLTILGAGGMGKSRLAVEVARARQGELRDGVCYVPLTEGEGLEALALALVGALRVPLASARDAAPQLASFLRDKRLLLLLDDLERAQEAAALLPALLEAAPGLEILVTSRERLRLRGETVYTLDGLTLPAGETREELLASSAVQLFVQRARMARAEAPLPDAELPAVARVCRRVGGMPLAIELAASLVDVLAPGEIAEEVERDLDILSAETRDLPPRMRSVRAVIDRSWARLDEDARAAFLRLSVFRDGFTRDAARQVADADVRRLKALADASLLQRDVEGGRFRMHALLRQYAAERLSGTAGLDAARAAHSGYFLRLLEGLDEPLRGSGQVEALAALESELENLRAAWQVGVEAGDAGAIDGGLECLYWFALIRGRVPEGASLLQAARARFGVTPDPEALALRRRLLLGFANRGEDLRKDIEAALAGARTAERPREIAFFLWLLGVNRYASADFEGSLDVLAEAVERWRALGDDFYRLECLHLLALGQRFLGRLEEARGLEAEIRAGCRRVGTPYALARALGSQGLFAVFEATDERSKEDILEALSIRRALGDRAGVAVSFVAIALDAFFRGDLPAARRYAREGRAQAEENGSLFPQTLAMSVLGWLAAVAEDYEGARTLCREALALAPDPNVGFIALLGQAMAACGLGEIEEAEVRLRDTLGLRSPMRTEKVLCCCLPVTALLRVACGAHAEAAALLGLAFTHPMSPTGWMERWPLLAHGRAEVEAALGPEPFAAAWEAGRALDLADVIGAELGDGPTGRTRT